MTEHDEELAQLRAGVSCAVLLERLPPPWQLDKAESTRRCLKYRRGKGEILLVTHEGRGWWDPCRSPHDPHGKGDIFSLVQYLEPGLNFGQVRKVLRPFIGLRPSYPLHERGRSGDRPEIPISVKWDRRRAPSRGSPAWRYLTEVRRIPASVVLAAIGTGVLREGPSASAWFAHHDHAGRLTGIEMRGPSYRGFSPGGSKSLFRLRAQPVIRGEPVVRLAVAEAPIDAMSLAALEGLRADTLYVATAGGIGPETITALEQELTALAARPDSVLVAATDADDAGDGYADRLAEMADTRGVRWERILPPHGLKDWNDALKRRAP